MMNNKKFYFGMLTLSLLTACSGNSMMEKISGERSPQAVKGARHAPELNAKLKSAPSLSEPVPAAAAAAASPYDNYDASGNFANKASKNAPAESPKTGNFFTRLIDGDDAAKPEENGAETRKPFAGSPYSPETSATAPIPAAPLPVANSSTIQKLSTVPEKPKRFEEIKGTHKQNMDDLQAEYAAASGNKMMLDNEITNGAAPAPAAASNAVVADKSDKALQSPEALLNKGKPVAVAPEKPYIEKPYIEKPPVAEKIEQPVVTSLPEINVAAPVETATSTATPDSAPVARQADVYNAEPLPEPEVLKIMRPSRYESRGRK